MINLSFHLPARLRLDINLVKSRKSLDTNPLIPNLRKVLRAKTGSKFSRLFRHIFENKKVKRLVGVNFAVMLFASSFIKSPVSYSAENDQEIIQAPVILTTQTGVQFPLEEVKVSQGFRFYHPGIDFDAVTGDPIKPIMAGVVQETGYSRFGYGNMVLVSHGGGVTTLYAHLSKIDVATGQGVDQNTKIGEVGATGRAFGDHLHFELLEDGRAVNPSDILGL